MGQDLKEKFGEIGYILWTPYRSDIKGAEEYNNRILKRLHRTIELRFSILVHNYGIERNLTRSVIDFWSKIKLTVFLCEHPLNQFWK